jgi:hypothetical protein
MKKLLSLILIWAMLLFATSAFSANESVTQSTKFYSNGFTVHTYSVTADDADGSVTSTATLNAAGTAFNIVGLIVMVEINPGATGPTNGAWDVNLQSSDGVQILGTQADDLSSTASIAVAPKPTSGNMDGSYFSNGQLTMSIDDNSVNSAVFTVRIFYYRYK